MSCINSKGQLFLAGFGCYVCFVWDWVGPDLAVDERALISMNWKMNSHRVNCIIL